MKLFYQLFIFLYPKAAWLLGFYNEKARKWVLGRRSIFKHLRSALQGNDAPLVWMHCASLGEFEQGRPILESIKKQYPQHRVLLTFFSPSGYEVRKNDPLADYISYLPMDGAMNARRFFNIVNPSLIIFVKYEFWYYYSREAAKRKIPLLLASGIFRADQLFFKWYGEFYRSILRQFSYLFVQDETSFQLMQQIGLQEKTAISGDTRFDRVIEVLQGFSPIATIEHFVNHHPCIVAGSTWTEDDEELDHYINTHPELKCIIAPHEIIPDRLEECLKLYHRSMLYTDYEKAIQDDRKFSEPQVLIINNYGMLTRLYHYATVCLVGGGFGGDGVHNVLEAAVYEKPVLIGPVFDKYLEAVELVDNGGCIPVENALELESVLNQLLNPEDGLYKASATAARSYVFQKAGATQKIIDYIQANRLLTN